MWLGVNIPDLQTMVWSQIMVCSNGSLLSSQQTFPTSEDFPSIIVIFMKMIDFQSLYGVFYQNRVVRNIYAQNWSIIKSFKYVNIIFQSISTWYIYFKIYFMILFQIWHLYHKDDKGYIIWNLEIKCKPW